MKGNLAMTNHIEERVPTEGKLSHAAQSDMQVKMPSLDSLPQLLEDGRLTWLDKRRMTKELLRHELLLLQERTGHAGTIEQVRLDLATQAEIAQLNTLFAFEALRTQATIQKLVQTLGTEVMTNLDIFMVNYAKQVTRHRREIKQSKGLEGAIKRRLLARTDKSFHHLLGTVEKIVDDLFNHIEAETSED
jgi:hypothetical protein